MSRYASPTPFITNTNGKPIAGAMLYFYATGTTTLKTIYSDSGFVTATTNPQVADASGRYSGDIFLDGVYKVVQKDASGVTLWTKDPVGDIASGQFEVWTNDNTYAKEEIVRGSDDKYYISLADANQGNNPISVPASWEAFYLNRTNHKFGTAIDDTDINGSNALTLPTDGDYFTMTGTQQIDTIVAVGVGRVIGLQAGSARTLTHHATNLILIGGADITTASGDIMFLHEYSAGNWRMLGYERSTGYPVVDPSPNKVVQIVPVFYGALATNTATMPLDDTIPVITEGAQYMSVTITPSDSANIIILECQAFIGASTSGAAVSGAVFKTAVTNALASNQTPHAADNTKSDSLRIKTSFVAGTTSSVTYTFRAGMASAGTTTFNGNSGARLFGGNANSFIIATEVTP